MKFSYGDNYFIRKENYLTGYKANSRLTVYTIIAIVYAVIEWQVRSRNPDSQWVLYAGMAISGALSILLVVLFIRKMLRNRVFDIGILVVALFSIYLLINNLMIFFGKF
ncbi:MAG TPA: hypothetical protein VLZ33_06250 [Dysgonamonadaceae bacterium]|nr:hypothetical protein [Dysgonamonadaceae bacterium]